MSVVTYNKTHYDDIYNDDFIAKQQFSLESYLCVQRGGFTSRINYILNLLEHVRGKDALDLGCGVGTFALILAKRGYNTTGLDISANSIDKCLENSKRFSIDNAKFVIGDCAEYNFTENSFDSIIAADIVEHLPALKLKRSLANCYKWLRPGGTIVIHTFPTMYYHLTLGKRALLLLPLYCIPRNFAPFYVPLANIIFNLTCMIFKRQPYISKIEKSVHCNPPHPFIFKAQLEEIGFNIVEYNLVKESLSGLVEDAPCYNWCKDLIRRHEIIQPTIVAVARKRKL